MMAGGSARSGIAGGDRPIGEAEFAAAMGAFAPFEPMPHLAVAVSGGADSMALCGLAARWAGAAGGRVTALIVDHRLREASGAEAAWVAGEVARAAIDREVLGWEGAKPTTGVQAAARHQRLRLLTAACRRLRILHLLLAHHASDQSETIAMRAQRGPGFGLAGMSMLRELDQTRVLRPLLGFAKARLVATLRAAGQAWIEDPSNHDRRFERVRVRQALGRGVSASRQGNGRATADAGERRSEIERAGASLLATAACIHPLGFVRLDLDLLLETAPAIVLAALGGALRAVGGKTFAPGHAALARLWAVLGDRDDARGSLGGCLVTRQGRRITITREPGRISEQAALRPGRMLWDGRFSIEAAAGLPDDCAVRRLGLDGLAELRAGARRWHCPGVPATALISLPGVWRAGQLFGCPALDACAPASRHARSLVAAYLQPRMPLAVPPFRGPIVVC